MSRGTNQQDTEHNAIQEAAANQRLPEDLATIKDAEPREVLRRIIRHAVARKASDLFLHANSNHYAVLIRRLGAVEQLVVLPVDQGVHVLHLIKSMAEMDLTERRWPLDGRMAYEVDDMLIDFRINSIGSLHGEDLVMRLLPSAKDALQLHELGFVGTQLADVKSMLRSGGGLLLVTGPIGAGKSTTLYACLNHINDGRRVICTLEDPIEQVIRGVRQCRVQPKLGLDFLDLLKGILRQSPDVIMIGEIRDEETAHTAIRAANSGHLVLSTLHSPLAAGAIQTLLGFGVNPYFLSNCLLGIVAQRLIRTLSEKSRQMFDVSHSPETFKDVARFLEPDQGKVIYGPDESDPEAQEGYVSESGLFEVMKVNHTIRRMIADGEALNKLQEAAVRSGMLDFRRAALLKVACGTTGPEEMARVIPTAALEEHDSYDVSQTPY